MFPSIVFGMRGFALVVFITLAQATIASAYAAETGSIRGHVVDSAGLPVPSADVVLDGPASARTITDRSGRFEILDLPTGVYHLTVTKGAYVPLTREDVSVLAGSPTSVDVALVASSFSSLRQIGSVATSAAGPNAGGINTTAAAISTIRASAALDQGLTSLTQVLNQTPGIITTQPNFGASSAAFASSVQEPQIRGALPYESLVEIDGHPLAVGSAGFYSLLYLTPFTMQDAELVRGPGSMPDVITGAIGGTLNYRTLEPTRQPHAGIDLDYRNDGALSSNYQFTGQARNGRLGYAFDYGIIGQNGPLQNYRAYTASLIPNINGQPICGGGAPGCPIGSGPAPPANVYPPSALSLTFPVALCCDYLNSPYNDHTYFAKLRYAFSPQTSVMASYLGATALQVQQLAYQIGGLYFAPPAGYAGSLPAGTPLPLAFGGYGNNIPTERNQQGLFETEFRTAVGRSTVLLRYYTGAQQDLVIEPPANAADAFVYNVWGGLPIGPGGTTQFFNGQPETFSGATGVGIYQVADDHFTGETGEIDIPSRNAFYTASLDRTQRSSYYEYFGTAVVPRGASQAIITGMLRGTFSLGPKLTATVGNYLIGYTSHYTRDGGLTWADASKSLDVPRLALTYLADRDKSFRISAGSSFAPPYLALINTQGGPPIGNNSGFATYYTQTLNNGTISPETSFGADLGFDQRLRGARDTMVSADVYQTTLHGQFLPSTFVSGTYTPPSGANRGRTEPLFTTTTMNLGVSHYKGLELSVRRAPATGLGFILQGAFIRGYTDSLPPSFYGTAAGPYTTNLAIVPNVNFYGGGNGYNGIGGVPNLGIAGGSLPYMQGYCEGTYRFRNKTMLLIGGTLYGSNNSFNVPAFWTFNASARVQLTKSMTLQLSAINFNDALRSPLSSLQGGLIRIPLANGQEGTTTLGDLGPATFHLTVHQSIGQ
jgi:hypothetical protein